MTASEPQALPSGPKPGAKIRFTPENARYYAAKSHQSRSKRNAELQVADNPIEPSPAPEPFKREDMFVPKTLTRVRKQLTRLLDMLEDCDDPIKCDRLGAAIGRLAEIEQKLAGRPLPGSLRPASPKQRQSRSGNSMPEPTPIGE